MSSYAGKKITAYHDNALAAVRKFSFREYCKLNVRKKSRWLPGKSSDPM